MMLSLRTSPLAVSPFRSGPSFATPRRLLSASSSSSSSFTGGQPRSFPSKLHPGLYYHQNHPHLDPAHQGTTTLVSYLPTPPPSLKFSPTTIGTLRPLKNPSPGPSRVFSVELGRGGDVALTSESALDGPEADEGVPPISPRTLTENPDFLRLVHEVISMNLADDAWLQTQAKSVHADTHIHISDQRQPADANRIADPQDILGSVLVQNSHLVPDSYEPNHVAYRLVTEAGLMRLPGGLGERLREACERVWELEREAAAEEAAAEEAAAAEQSQQ